MRENSPWPRSTWWYCSQATRASRRPCSGEPAVVHLDADLLAREPGQFGGDDEGVGGLAQVDGRRPALRAGGGQPLESVLNREQIAERIPARESHDTDRSTGAGAGRSAGRASDGRVGGLRPCTSGPDPSAAVLRLQGSTTHSNDRHMADTLLATRLEEGHDHQARQRALRIHDLMHVTPGNLRGFVRVRRATCAARRCPSRSCARKTSSSAPRSTRRRCSILYSDGEGYHFMDTESYEQIHMSRRGARRLGRLPEARDDDPGRVLRRASRSASSCRRPST